MDESRTLMPAASLPRLSPRALTPVRWAGLCVAAAGAYYGSAQLGYWLEFSGPVAAIVWLPVGVGVSVLYVGGLGLWPGLVLGDLLANDYSTLPIGSAIGQTCGNVLEVVVAALLLRRLARRGSPLDSAVGVGRMVLALGTGTALSATVGGVSLLLGGVVEATALPHVWRTWWLGDTCGALLVVPLVLAWHRAARPARPKGGAVEGALMLAAVAIATEVGFRSQEPLLYLVFPPLIWAALRLGQRGATLALVVTVSIAIWNTTHSIGPFSFGEDAHAVATIQLYIAVAALSTLFLAAVVVEREQLGTRLAAARIQTFVVAAAERHRLERNLHDGVQNRLLALLVRVRRARERTGTTDAVLDLVEGELDGIYDELRALAHGLHPLGLTRLGLAGAVRSLAARSPVPVTLGELPAAALDPTVEEVAYLTIAEAFTNAQKHAHASSIRAAVARVDGLLRIEVADDGVGGASETAGSGLAGLRDRLEALGGSLAVESSAAAGTRVLAVVPAPGAAPLEAA